MDMHRMNQIKETLVSPAIAKKWLDQNKVNRPLRIQVVQRYAKDMVAGKWQANGETIKIAEDGVLIDGQHRLHAVVQAKTNVMLLVVSGLPRESFHTIDTGMRRTAAQIVGMAGFKNSASTASAGRWIKVLEGGGSFAKLHISSQEILEVIECHPLIHHFAYRHTGTKGLKTLMQSPSIAVMTLAAEKYGQAMIDTFLDSFSGGESLKRTDPVYELRERLIGNTTKVAKLAPATIVALTIKAVNAYVHQKTLGVLRWSPNEEWPTI